MMSPYIFIPASSRNLTEFSDAGSYVGARGFEPPTSWSQTTRSTKLSYAPESSGIITTIRSIAHLWKELLFVRQIWREPFLDCIN
jgi:hypothetical protein